MMPNLAVAAALLLQSRPLGPAAEDWPRFRGRGGDGISAARGIRRDWRVRPPRLVWRVPLGDNGYAGPSVSGGLVFVVDRDGPRDVVRALRLADGAEAWRTPYDEPGDNVFGHARATPTVDGDRVYVLSREGLLICLGARDGRVVWQRHLVKDLGGRRPMWYFASSPIIDGQALIVQPGAPAGGVAALDKMTGRTLWTGGEDDIGAYGTPSIATLAGRRQLVMTVWKGTVGMDLETRKIAWRIPWPTRDGCTVASPIVLGQSVFITSSYNMGCALIDVTQTGAAIRWRSQEIASHMATPVLWQGRIYGAGDPGVLVCLDPADGSVKWRQTGWGKASVIAADGLLLVLNGESGEMALVRLNPDRYEELGRFTPLGGQSWTAPIVAQGKLIVRNRKEIACFDLR